MNGELLAWQGKSQEARATRARRDRGARSPADSTSTSTTAMQAIAALELSAGNYGAVRAAVSAATTTTW